MADTAKVKLSKADERRMVALVEHITEHRPDDLRFTNYGAEDRVTGLDIFFNLGNVSFFAPFKSTDLRLRNNLRVRRALRKVRASRPYRGTALVDDVLSKDPSFTARLVAA